VRVRTAEAEDWPSIWPIWRDVVSRGDTYAWLPDTTEPDAKGAWMLPPPAQVFVLEDDDGSIAGTALLKPNQPGLGDHVANASFMIDPGRSGRGLGRTLAEAVLAAARERGFTGMQFNAVVASNAPAIALWTSLGFEVVGRIPGAFRHAELGPVDFLVMHRALG